MSDFETNPAGTRDELERLRTELATAYESIDANWVQHQQVVAQRQRAERAEAELADERKRHDENLVLWKQAEAELAKCQRETQTLRNVAVSADERAERAEAERDRFQRGLDALGLAIANAGYVWTPEMRSAYEKATNRKG